MDELKSYVTAIDHVGIAVPDMDEAISFYRDVLGLELFHEEVNEEQGVREAMLRPPGDSGAGAAVQLLAPLGPDTTIGKFLDRKGPGLQQLAYRVTDVDAAAEALRAKGKRVMYEQARHGTANSRVNFVHPKDAGGVLIELVEPAPQDASPAH
jgi:methylmalonyl-CoA/ethylmalonyl-CoA epimerase